MYDQHRPKIAGTVAVLVLLVTGCEPEEPTVRTPDRAHSLTHTSQSAADLDEATASESDDNDTEETPAPLPAGFDDVELGHVVPEDLEGRHKTRSVDLELFDDTVEMAVRITDSGHVGGVAVFEPVDDPFSGGVETTWERWERELIELYGPPDSRGPESAWLDDRAPVWKTDGRIGQLGRIGRGDRVLVAFLIRRDDPTVPCEPEDGFDEVLQRLQEAARQADDNEALASFFDFPVQEMSRKVVRHPEQSDRRDTTAFGQWIEVHDYDWSDLFRPPTCDPLWARYYVNPRDSAGQFFFESVDGEWKITGFSTAG